MPAFSRSSLEKLNTADPRLQLLFNEIIRHRDCTILCGHRDQEEQEQAFRTGNSKARFGESPHNKVPALAVDVMPYPINWDDLKGIHEFAGFVQGVASQMGIKVKWGGRFKNFFDGPHYELEEP